MKKYVSQNPINKVASITRGQVSEFLIVNPQFAICEPTNCALRAEKL